MKISPAILINKNVTAISDIWPPTVNEGSPNCDPEDAPTPPPTPQMAEDAAIPPTPQVIAEEWGECKEQGELGNKIGPDS